jgi:quercetin dioxygenase-like cupin family protein
LETNEIEKSVSFITVEIIEYVPHSVLIKTILKKSTGNISVMSFDAGEGMTEKRSPFDSFIQVIDGQAEIVIDAKSTLLKVSESIVVPANALNHIKSNGRFKLVLTVIKSGYDI